MILGICAIWLTPIGLVRVVLPKLDGEPDKTISGTVYLLVGILSLLALSFVLLRILLY